MLSEADFALLATVMWQEHKGVWAVRARGSNTFHRAPVLADAIRAALDEEEQLW